MVKVLAVETVVVVNPLIVNVLFPVLVIQPISTLLPQVPQMSHDGPFQ